jgi:hypothetical protein
VAGGRTRHRGAGCDRWLPPSQINPHRDNLIVQGWYPLHRALSHTPINRSLKLIPKCVEQARRPTGSNLLTGVADSRSQLSVLCGNRQRWKTLPSSHPELPRNILYFGNPGACVFRFLSLLFEPDVLDPFLSISCQLTQTKRKRLFRYPSWVRRNTDFVTEAVARLFALVYGRTLV